MNGVRLTILYAGRVQGVGFRAATARLAGRFAVTGSVGNLADGRVEVVAEGEPDEVDRFFAAVAERWAGHVESTDRQRAGATGEFDAFGVWY